MEIQMGENQTDDSGLLMKVKYSFEVPGGAQLKEVSETRNCSNEDLKAFFKNLKKEIKMVLEDLEKHQKETTQKFKEEQ